MLVLINVTRVGKVEEDVTKYVITLLDNFYRKIQQDSLEVIDLVLISNYYLLKAYISNEASNLNIPSYGFESGFIALHDSWRGIPRIIVCVERLNRLDRKIQEAVIHHEATHSIIHGSPEYYIFPVNESLKTLAKAYGLNAETTQSILYLISIAVKDFEVTEFLIRKGYGDEQLEYAKYLINTDIEDSVSWSIARHERVLKLMYLTSKLKDVSCVVPFFLDHRYKGVATRLMEEAFAHISKKERDDIINIVRQLNYMRELNTFLKVEEISRILTNKLLAL